MEGKTLEAVEHLALKKAKGVSSKYDSLHPEICTG